MGVVLAVVVAALTLAGSAVAFDCVRVSSSLQGLQQSTNSGNWLLFDFSSADSTQQTLAQIGENITDAEAECFAAFYATTGQPLYFALGVGVAGKNGVLAWNNPTPSLGDGKGIDHLEQSGIFEAFLQGSEECAAAGEA